MLWRARAAALLSCGVLAACGAGARETSAARDPVVEPTIREANPVVEPDEATEVTTPGVGACSTLGEVIETDRGRCECVRQSYCGGTPPSDELVAELARLGRWMCEPPASHGCADAEIGVPCPVEGASCGEIVCCGVVFVCTEHTWQQLSRPCPH